MVNDRAQVAQQRTGEAHRAALASRLSCFPLWLYLGWGMRDQLAER